MGDVADPQADQVAAAQLAVDGEVEQRQVARLPAICRCVRIAQTSWALMAAWPTSLPLFQGVGGVGLGFWWSDMVCLLGGCRGNRSLAHRGQRAVTDPKRTLAL